MGLASILSGLIPGRKRSEVQVHYYGYAKKTPKPMVEVIMQRDAVGAPDGITRTEYKAGQTYLLPEDLAGCFFSTGEADPAEAHAQPQADPISAPPAHGEPNPQSDAGEPAKTRPRVKRPARGA